MFSSVQALMPSNLEIFQRLLVRDYQLELLEEPFTESRLEILGALSARILRNRPSDPTLAALGSWLRPAHLHEMLRKHAKPHQQQSDVLLAPAGLVFHIAPGNVDTMFIYSWALSFLCGNVNIVRLPQDRSPILDQLMDLLSAQDKDHPALLQGNAFITYAHQSEVTEAISAACNHRVVWGGDETVSRIRAISLNPHASERSFPSKRSMALLDAQSFLNASEDTQARLASQFYADVFPFDQLACSSPQFFFWLADEVQFNAAIDHFDKAISAELERRNEIPDTGRAVIRHNFAFEAAAAGQGRAVTSAKGFTSLRFTDAESVRNQPTCGAGTFAHVRLTSLSELPPLVDSAAQTLTHWGIPQDQLHNLAKQLAHRGLDRIVPTGQALHFSPIWDSHDLFNDFTRKLALKSG